MKNKAKVQKRTNEKNINTYSFKFIEPIPIFRDLFTGTSISGKRIGTDDSAIQSKTV